MKKRFLGIIAATAVAAACAFGAAGCGFTDDFLNGNKNPDTGEADDFLDDNGSDVEHIHSYTGTKTVAATCTKGGYTLHICDCGDKYQDGEVKPLGHDFVNYVCTRCKEVDPAAPVTNGLKFAPFTDENDEITSYQVVGVEDDAKNAENIEIPATYNGKPVTAVGKKAFYGCKMKSVTIPESVTDVGEQGFYYCVNLESVSLPESVTVIDYEAFSTCAALKTVTLGDKVTEIGTRAFENCGKLSKINLPAALKTINVQAFWQCRSLENITLPEGLQAVYEQAFETCESLKSLHFPASVTNIGCGVTAGCNGLTSLTVASGNTYYRSDRNCVIQRNGGMYETVLAGCPASVIPDDGAVCYIGSSAFKGLNITEIIIPDSVQSIGTQAFMDCTELSSVIFNDVHESRLGSIEDAAFACCYNLGYFLFPDNLAAIGASAFEFSGIGRAEFNEGLRVIRYRAFACTPLFSVDLPESIRVINWAFCDTPLREINVRGEYADSWKVVLHSYNADYYEINVPQEYFHVDGDTENGAYVPENMARLLAIREIDELIELLQLTPQGMTFTNYSVKKLVPDEENEWWNKNPEWWY